MRNRYILCLLLCGVLLYYALPRMQLYGEGQAFYFSVIWLIFLLFAAAGNLAALLYAPKNRRVQKLKKIDKSRARSYQ